MSKPLFVPAGPSPVRQLLRQRFAPSEDRALVLLSGQGEDRVELPRGRDIWGYPRPSIGAVFRREFDSMGWVSLTERRIVVEVPRRGSATPTPARARYEVAWNVSNPVAAARSGLTEATAGRLIVQDIRGTAGLPEGPDPLRQPPTLYGTAQVEPPGHPRNIGGAGLAYWFLDPPAGLLPAPSHPAELLLPPGFGEAHQEAYRFYREVITGGPVGLAALWLLHHPDQAREVLDWTVAHDELLTDRDGWERTLAATLQGLSKRDRGFVGVNLARLLSEVGVPQGDEVLRRIGEADAPRGGMNGFHRGTP
ncbi:hypothetical protein ACFFSH_27105 [Streptomyces filamentosus]|uniref:Uncharacterized protein n=1 Tax=Streptomyces filamentosus TaxID=67294 RepID=A0A919BCU9_STRFL|nr:hypothetical protein [Streptomyces filamentosus]GHF79624.1 hypothetical protein GCM10017667_03880 [Streptomyces filamentosus]